MPVRAPLRSHASGQVQFGILGKNRSTFFTEANTTYNDGEGETNPDFYLQQTNDIGGQVSFGDMLYLRCIKTRG